MYMSVYKRIYNCKCWCSSEECSMASIVRAIIPDCRYKNTKKNHFIKIVPTDCFICKAHRGTQLK